jgi:hypothetical protein
MPFNAGLRLVFVHNHLLVKLTLGLFFAKKLLVTPAVVTLRYYRGAICEPFQLNVYRVFWSRALTMQTG